MAHKSSNRGDRVSTWQVVRRCLAILRRVERGPANKEQILAAVYAAEGDDAYGGASGEILTKRFEGDKGRLANHLGVQIRYDSAVGGYIIVERDEALLDLPDAHLETLAFLADTFQPDSPRATEVRQLIDTLLALLPQDRRRFYDRARGLGPDLNLRLRDSEPIASDVWTAVLEAYQVKQELQFDYLSSTHDDQTPRQHHVQPWDLDFTDRGHYRLRGYCLFNDGPHGSWHPNDFISYRLSRILPGTAQVLPRKLPAVRPHGRLHPVIFELSPRIARFGVSQRKELEGEPTITEMDEGWVRVEGRSHDIFTLARNLLYYGAQCRVLGGPELLTEMRGLVSGLSEVYL